ncbi:MAG: hypothetical protein LBM97_02250 [Candidatus Nomurabacteria bacterium]|nr:hypothetical protein [Candidatus Nomurabacteria bacterium]
MLKRITKPKVVTVESPIKTVSRMPLVMTDDELGDLLDARAADIGDPSKWTSWEETKKWLDGYIAELESKYAHENRATR